MSHHWDEFTKSLAEEPLPRRESLRRLGAVMAGAVLSPLGLNTAMAGGDPCKAFCRCSNKKQQNACLVACRACGNDPRRLCGTGCGNYFCCGAATCCGDYCAELDSDGYNCGACGYVCEPPGPYEQGACIDGECRYACVPGAMFCDGACTPVLWDRNNCGGCGTACDGATPYCIEGECSQYPPCPGGQTRCFGVCRSLNQNTFCGTSCETAVVCGLYEFCEGGACAPVYDWWSFE